MNSLNVLQKDGGMQLKQGDFGSRFAFQLVDENHQAMPELEGQEAVIKLGKVWRTTTKVENGEVAFHLDAVLPRGGHVLEVVVGDYVFPSDRNTKVTIIPSETKYSPSQLYDQEKAERKEFTALSDRVAALEDKQDQDTVYDDEPLTTRVQTLETKLDDSSDNPLVRKNDLKTVDFIRREPLIFFKEANLRPFLTQNGARMSFTMPVNSDLLPFYDTLNGISTSYFEMKWAMEVKAYYGDEAVTYPAVDRLVFAFTTPGKGSMRGGSFRALSPAGEFTLQGEFRNAKKVAGQFQLLASISLKRKEDMVNVSAAPIQELNTFLTAELLQATGEQFISVPNPVEGAPTKISIRTIGFNFRIIAFWLKFWYNGEN